MLMVRERIDKWTEDSGMLGEIQGGFRRGRHREDNLFMLERLIEMVKGRKEEIFVAFLDMDKVYDQVNRKKLFEVMRCYRVHEKLIRLIERIYYGSMVKFELEKVTTGWCKSDSGVRQGCPLSPLPFNIYVREFGKVINDCVHGVKYAVVGKDGVLEWKSQAGLLYADEVCLMANSEEDMKVIMEKVNECVVEYGLKVNEKKSKVVCINGEVGRHRWIGEVEEYKYLGITIEVGKHGSFKSMGDRLKEANGLIGMVKYAAERSGSKYVIGKEEWKTMIVSKLMYGCGALAWYQPECDN